MKRCATSGHQPARRAKSTVAPNPHMMAPDACRVLATNDGRLTSPARAFAAQWVTSKSTLVLNATEISPRTTNCEAMFADGSINCGMKARKNAAVFGLSASTTMPSRKARRAPVVCTCVGPTTRASRHVFIPSQTRYRPPAIFSKVKASALAMASADRPTAPAKTCTRPPRPSPTLDARPSVRPPASVRATI